MLRLSSTIRTNPPVSCAARITLPRRGLQLLERCQFRCTSAVKLSHCPHPAPPMPCPGPACMPALDRLYPVLLLVASNVFMTFAWYGHLKYRSAPLPGVILASWGIAFSERSEEHTSELQSRENLVC